MTQFSDGYVNKTVYRLKKEQDWKRARYVPVSEFDDVYWDMMPYGTHLVTVTKNSKYKITHIDAATAPVVAAATLMVDTLAEKINKLCMYNPPGDKDRTPTPEQVEAWERMCDAFGFRPTRLIGKTTYDIVYEILDVIKSYTNNMLEHPEVASAWEEMLVTMKMCGVKE